MTYRQTDHTSWKIGNYRLEEIIPPNFSNKLTGAFFGNVAVPIAMKPFNTRVKASISKSVGVPKCTVLVVSTVINSSINIRNGICHCFRPVVPSQY